MNKQLALILLAKLASPAYLDRTSGVVQVITKVSNTDDGLKVEKKFPFTSSATHDECNKPEAMMIPNSKFKSCLYFEDNGVTVLAEARDGFTYQSRMRLVCWLNTIRIAGAYDNVLSAKIMADVIKRLTADKNFNSTPFIRISVKQSNIPAQDASIFSPYDYNEKELQYLMPPYDFFAIDLVIDFTVPHSCLASITVTNTDPCPIPTP